MAGLMASETAMRVTRPTGQLPGGDNYTQDLPVGRMMGDAKITEIHEGTREVQRQVSGTILTR